MEERQLRKTRTGLVVSNKMEKSIVVSVSNIGIVNPVNNDEPSVPPDKTWVIDEYTKVDPVLGKVVVVVITSQHGSSMVDPVMNPS
jgi:hypothetical protein